MRLPMALFAYIQSHLPYAGNRQHMLADVDRRKIHSKANRNYAQIDENQFLDRIDLVGFLRSEEAGVDNWMQFTWMNPDIRFLRSDETVYFMRTMTDEFYFCWGTK